MLRAECLYVHTFVCVRANEKRRVYCLQLWYPICIYLLLVEVNIQLEN